MRESTLHPVLQIENMSQDHVSSLLETIWTGFIVVDKRRNTTERVNTIQSEPGRSVGINRTIAGNVIPTKPMKSVKHASRSFIELHVDNRDSASCYQNSKVGHVDNNTTFDQRSSIASNDSLTTSRRNQQRQGAQKITKQRVSEVKIIGTKKNTPKVYNYVQNPNTSRCLPQR